MFFFRDSPPPPLPTGRLLKSGVRARYYHVLPSCENSVDGARQEGKHYRRVRNFPRHRARAKPPLGVGLEGRWGRGKGKGDEEREREQHGGAATRRGAFARDTATVIRWLGASKQGRMERPSPRPLSVSPRSPRLSAPCRSVSRFPSRLYRRGLESPSYGGQEEER